MRIETNTINLTGMIFCMFWYAIYALACLILSASRIWLNMNHSNMSSVKAHSKFGTTKTPLNFKTT